MHPFLASAPDAFTALARAHCWRVLDADWSHSTFWQAQVSECEEQFLATLHPRVASATRKTLLANAMVTGHALADKARRVRVKVGFDD